MSVEQSARSATEVVMRRRELLYNVLLGSMAFAGLAPILALAKSHAPVPKSGDRVCVELRNLLRKEFKTNELLSGDVIVSRGGEERLIRFYVLRGSFADALAPSIVIDRSEWRVFAYATDLEWLTYTTTKRDDIGIFDEVMEMAKKQGKMKVLRYTKLIKEIVTTL
ncbi:MAG: hypothetical protein LM577_06905 [Thermoproteaceae archaeon]|nr:hypothetical protein [Thermoproteaceae archaeon]